MRRLGKQGVVGQLRLLALRDLKMSRKTSNGGALQHISPFVRKAILSELYFKSVSEAALFKVSGSPVPQ